MTVDTLKTPPTEVETAALLGYLYAAPQEYYAVLRRLLFERDRLREEVKAVRAELAEGRSGANPAAEPEAPWGRGAPPGYGRSDHFG